MVNFAKGTRVSTDRTRLEIELLLQRAGATATAVFNRPEQAAVCFEMNERRILFRLNMPDPEKFATVKIGRSVRRRSPEQQRQAHEQACKERWRSLLLAIKAKLVSVHDGVETFEEAFMAHVVMPDGQTVADHVKPRIESAYKDQRMVPLLPGPSS